MVWMSGPPEAVALNQFTHGPVPWHRLTPDEGNIIVAKNRRGETVICETWEGIPYPIPNSK
jgi:hypothetical protein